MYATAELARWMYMRQLLHDCLTTTLERSIMKMHTLIAALALTVGGSAFAQAPAAPAAAKDPIATPKIDQRQVNQEKRIQQGVASGAVTPKEASMLEKEQNKIQSAKVAVKADGKVTKAERRKLHRAQNRASAHIKRHKHNRRTVAPKAAR